MSDPKDKKPLAPVLDLISYAGTPNSIPAEELNSNWGSLNKQLAFSNLSEADILDIEDILRIRQLKSMGTKRDYELRNLELKGSDQSQIVSKCLSSLGKNGFLLKRATTASHEFKNINDEKKRWLNIGSRPQPQPQPQAQGVR
jgi:hypothetical protein